VSDKIDAFPIETRLLRWLRQTGAALCLAIVFFISYNQRVGASEGLGLGIEDKWKSGATSGFHDVHQLQFDVEIEKQASGEYVLDSHLHGCRRDLMPAGGLSWFDGSNPCGRFARENARGAVTLNDGFNFDVGYDCKSRARISHSPIDMGFVGDIIGFNQFKLANSNDGAMSGEECFFSNISRFFSGVGGDPGSHDRAFHIVRLDFGGLHESFGSPVERVSENCNQNGGDCGSSIAIFVNDVSSATDAYRGGISERENEWWRIFFCLFSLSCGLFLYAGLKRR
jgi:hypothetical protein